MPGQLVTPNLYQLTGPKLHVTYSTSSLDGKPHLTYQDAYQTLNFRGDEIRAVETDAGTMVSVSIRRTVDMGSTSFSLLVPRVRIEQGSSAHVATEGVTTVHRFSIVPQFDRGQLDTYSYTALHGTATLVLF